MTDFLVLCNTGEGKTGWEVCALIQAVEASSPEEEAEKAIAQGIQHGEGEYWAVPLTDAVKLKAVDAGFVFEPVEEDAEPAESEGA